MSEDEAIKVENKKGKNAKRALLTEEVANKKAKKDKSEKKDKSGKKKKLSKKDKKKSSQSSESGVEKVSDGAPMEVAAAPEGGEASKPVKTKAPKKMKEKKEKKDKAVPRIATPPAAPAISDDAIENAIIPTRDAAQDEDSTTKTRTVWNAENIERLTQLGNQFRTKRGVDFPEVARQLGADFTWSACQSAYNKYIRKNDDEAPSIEWTDAVLDRTKALAEKHRTGPKGGVDWQLVADELGSGFTKIKCRDAYYKYNRCGRLQNLNVGDDAENVIENGKEKVQKNKWSEEMLEKVKHLSQQYKGPYGGIDFFAVARQMGEGFTSDSCRHAYGRHTKEPSSRCSWDEANLQRLQDLSVQFRGKRGAPDWDNIALQMGPNYTVSSCQNAYRRSR